MVSAIELSWWSFVECLPEDGMYFIVSPKDIVTARQRDEDDHISWLLEHEMFVVRLQCHSSTIAITSVGLVVVVIFKFHNL